MTELLLTCGIFAESSPYPGIAPPRIHSKSQHFRFAFCVLTGYPYEDACAHLAINPRTAERWRTDLRRTASRYFGRPVTYEFAARYALDATLRHSSPRLRDNGSRRSGNDVRRGPQGTIPEPCCRPFTVKE